MNTAPRPTAPSPAGEAALRSHHDSPPTTNVLPAELTRLYEAEAARIHGMVLYRCGDPAVAEEVTALTFESAARAFADGNGGQVTPAWLTTVAQRRLVDHWRRVARRAALDVRLRATAERNTAHEPELPEVWAALDALPPTQRAAVTLRYLDDWSVNEVAEGLDVSYKAAESLLSRGRRSLRAALTNRRTS